MSVTPSSIPLGIQDERASAASTTCNRGSAACARGGVFGRIVGHSDKVGRAAYNKKLSFRRAETVKAWLIGRGIAVKRLSVAGKGFDEPIDTNATDEGRANNRRIEFRVLK